MEWEKEQNLFSIENRKIYSQNQRYRYYRNHTRMVYRMGAYRYSITGELFGEQIGKDLKEDGIENDGRCYYWNLFHRHNSLLLLHYLRYVLKNNFHNLHNLFYNLFLMFHLLLVLLY